MRKQVSWKGRLLIGSGILISAAVIALPQQSDAPVRRSTKRVEPPRECTAQWFGHLPGGTEVAIEGLDGTWTQAGPLEFIEWSNGTAKLSGILEQGGRPMRGWRLEVNLAGAEAKNAQGPAAYSKLEGNLYGLGEFEGGLIRVKSGERTGLDSQLSFCWEWIERPGSIARVGQPQGRRAEQHFASFPIAFGNTAPWGVRDFQFDLGSVPGKFEWRTGGQFVEGIDGRASMTAVLAEETHPGRAFELELQFRELCGQGTFTRSYASCSGRLVGIEEFAGLNLEVRGTGDAFDVTRREGEEPTLFRAWGEFSTRVTSQPADFAIECRAGDTAGSMSFGLTSSSLRFAHSARGKAPARFGGEFAMQLGRWGEDYVFESGGTFVEFSDGSARLTGLVARRSSAANAFHLDVRFQGRHTGDALRGSPWLGMASDVYVENGGPIHQGVWHYYSQFSGSLEGTRDLAGVNLSLNETSTPFQLGFGANGRTMTQGAYSTFEIQSAELADGVRPAPDRGVFSFDLRGWNEDTVQVAQGHEGLELEGIGSDFYFVSGGRLRQHADGTARMTGVLGRKSFPADRFFLDAELGQRSCEPNGATTYASFDGFLTGLDDFLGAELWMRQSGGGLTLDVERGGVVSESTIVVDVLSQPTGERRFRVEHGSGRLAVELSHDLEGDARQAFALPAVTLPGGHALYLPGIADDFGFQESGSFREFADGRACLEGRLVSAANPELGFDLRIDFEGRFEAGETTNAQLHLPASVYAERGGPVDPELWHFYRKAQGILVGVRQLSGAVLQIKSDKDALQVGLGANSRNLEYGASGKFQLELSTQPIRGAIRGANGESIGGSVLLPTYYPGGEIHIDLPAAARE